MDTLIYVFVGIRGTIINHFLRSTRERLFLQIKISNIDQTQLTRRSTMFFSCMHFITLRDAMKF
jgi:hypothetical protein